MNNLADISKTDESLKCAGCGALLTFKPGTNQLQCGYCGENQSIAHEDSEQLIAATDYEAFVASVDTAVQNDQLKVVSCSNCGSQTVLDQFVTADQCPFCTAALVLDPKGGQQYVAPHYVLPFEITREQGVAFFQNWLKGLWWTPNDLEKKVSQSASALKGVYLPYWAYDTYTVTDYTGERGDYYYTTETYMETVDGKTQTKTRQVRHTSWSYASGTVDRDFHDLLVPASKSLPVATLDKLTPWAFQKMVKFDQRYMSGFRSETYQINPAEGFDLAARQTVDPINADIRDDIGGDEQRINNTETEFKDKAIKYLMLPVWVSAYSYKDKIYQFAINASTGEVIGGRPLSAVKIVLAILFVLALIVAVVLYLNYKG